MLQIIVGGTAAVIQARDALTNGCRWIELSMSTNCEAELLAADAKEIAEMCRANEAFFVIDNDIDLVESLQVHGVVLGNGSRSELMAVRERLGAEAVLGACVPTIDDATALKGVDVDYLQLPADGVTDLPADLGIHLVATGKLQVEEMANVIAAGFAGVAMKFDDVCGRIPDYINALQKARFA
jgi:hypothetical protein